MLAALWSSGTVTKRHCPRQFPTPSPESKTWWWWWVLSTESHGHSTGIGTLVRHSSVGAQNSAIKINYPISVSQSGTATDSTGRLLLWEAIDVSVRDAVAKSASYSSPRCHFSLSTPSHRNQRPQRDNRRQFYYSAVIIIMCHLDSVCLGNDRFPTPPYLIFNPISFRDGN